MTNGSMLRRDARARALSLTADRVLYDVLYACLDLSPSVARASPLAADASQDVVVHETLRGLLRPAMAEMIGSAMFIFIACGSAMTTSLEGAWTVGAGTIGIALSFGMSIFVIAYSIGHISGGHLNFAVTLTFAVLRKISILKCVLYFFAQFLGGLIGIGFLKLVTPRSWWGACFAANFVHSDLTVGHALVVEFILTFFLMFVVMAACDSNKSNQTLVPFAIGMAVFCCHMLAIPLTGCSINPTRSFAASAAASGLSECPDAWQGQWVFWLGPIAGALTGGGIYEYCFHEGGYKVDALVSSPTSSTQASDEQQRRRLPISIDRSATSSAAGCAFAALHHFWSCQALTDVVLLSCVF